MKKQYIIAIAAVAGCIVLAVILGVLLSPAPTPYGYLKNEAIAPTAAFVPETHLLTSESGEGTGEFIVFYENSAGNIVPALLTQSSRSYEVAAYGAPLVLSEETAYKKITFPNNSGMGALVYGFYRDGEITGVMIGDRLCESFSPEGQELTLFWLWDADTEQTPEFLK